MIVTEEPSGIRNYSFECHDSALAAKIVAETVRTLDEFGGRLLSLETS